MFQGMKFHDPYGNPLQNWTTWIGLGLVTAACAAGLVAVVTGLGF